jgi:hypothetical protein
MTQFEELQAAHERLMEQSKAPEDVTGFVAEVQREIHNMCVAAEDIPAPRERDQLRAILRFWASYVYDRTGTYPDTTLHPAITTSAKEPSGLTGDTVYAYPATTSEEAAKSASSIAPDAVTGKPVSARAPTSLWWIVFAVGAALIVLLAVVYLATRPPSTAVNPPSGSEQVTTAQPSPFQPEIQWSVLTSGPSPFDANVWVYKLQLSATGGDGNYIFWVNGTRLPDISSNQFTVEGKDCVPEKPIVGVTSGGQATSLELVIPSPLPGCPQP